LYAIHSLQKVLLHYLCPVEYWNQIKAQEKSIRRRNIHRASL